MSATLPSHWLALVAVVFLLGLKHGLDPDHLAAIDGLTRFNASRRPRVSRWSGLLFSAGHGVVVTAGMMATDALNGLWVSHMVRSADARAAAASRLMSLAIAFTSLAIAALAAARHALPGLDEQVASWGMALSISVVVTVAAAYGLAIRFAARSQPVTPSGTSWNV